MKYSSGRTFDRFFPNQDKGFNGPVVKLTSHLVAHEEFYSF